MPVTQNDEPAQFSPYQRFVQSLERWVRVWLQLLVVALVLSVLGITPTAISLAAIMGPVWIIIVLLVLWGRMLDEIMNPRSDLEDGPR